MEKYKLSEADMKQIAHFISQRSLASVSSIKIVEPTEKYIDAFNQVMNILNEYNKTIN